MSIGIESMEHLPQVVKGGWRGLGAKEKEEFISWQQGNKVVVVPQLTDACMHGIGSGPDWWRACRVVPILTDFACRFGLVLQAKVP